MGKHADPLGTRRVVLGVLAWLLLGLAWWLVLRRDPSSWVGDLLVPLVAALVVAPLTAAWVRHNRRIYQRKGPRRGLPAVASPWATDSLGVPLELPEPALQAGLVRLSLAGGVKRYEVGA
jgi:hypothetical protein